MTDPRSQVALVLALIRELEGVMRAENGLLREMRLERLQTLQAEKAAFADSYEQALRRLRGDAAGLAGLDAAERDLLEASMRRFRAAARDNAERLLQARAVAEGVARALRDGGGEALPAPRYGVAPSRAVEGGARVIPIAFDRRC